MLNWYFFNPFQVTYNRVMSNHRSVTKPKDVKYKRINKAKSKSLEELRGRLRNWVEKGNKITISFDQSYAWVYYFLKVYYRFTTWVMTYYQICTAYNFNYFRITRLINRPLFLVKSLVYLIEISLLHVWYLYVALCIFTFIMHIRDELSSLVTRFYYTRRRSY